MNPEFLRRLTADILANAARRLKWGQPEDALVRVYRASELIGQVRAALRGLDTENMNEQDSSFQAWLAYMEKKREPVARVHGKYSLARSSTARYLNHTGDTIGRLLLDLDKTEGLRTKERNNSLLAQGFTAITPGRDKAVSATLRQVLSIFAREAAENAALFQCAQFGWLEGLPAAGPT
jgi:hypothetical protein